MFDHDPRQRCNRARCWCERVQPQTLKLPMHVQTRLGRVALEERIAITNDAIGLRLLISCAGSYGQLLVDDQTLLELAAAINRFFDQRPAVDLRVVLEQPPPRPRRRRPPDAPTDADEREKEEIKKHMRGGR